MIARHRLDSGLKWINLGRILETLQRLWYLGYLNVDTGRKLVGTTRPDNSEGALATLGNIVNEQNAP
ncbi:MAG: hypothetical protein R3C05_02660 [Pirellulaceae bacterium]